MNYDDWKLESPEEESENKCSYCGNPCEGTHCDKECLKAELND